MISGLSIRYSRMKAPISFFCCSLSARAGTENEQVASRSDAAARVGERRSMSIPQGSALIGDVADRRFAASIETFRGTWKPQNSAHRSRSDQNRVAGQQKQGPAAKGPAVQEGQAMGRHPTKQRSGYKPACLGFPS